MAIKISTTKQENKTIIAPKNQQSLSSSSINSPGTGEDNRDDKGIEALKHISYGEQKLKEILTKANLDDFSPNQVNNWQQSINQALSSITKNVKDEEVEKAVSNQLSSSYETMLLKFKDIAARKQLETSEALYKKREYDIKSNIKELADTVINSPVPELKQKARDLINTNLKTLEQVEKATSYIKNKYNSNILNNSEDKNDN